MPYNCCLWCLKFSSASLSFDSPFQSLSLFISPVQPSSFFLGHPLSLTIFYLNLIGVSSISCPSSLPLSVYSSILRVILFKIADSLFPVLSPPSLGLRLGDPMGFGGWFQKPAQWIVSLFHPHSAPEYFSGGTLPASAVIQGWPTLLWQLFRSLALKDGIQVFFFLLLLAVSVSRKWLCPLPVPHIPYFIVPRLSLSEGNTIILTTADSFSKMEFLFLWSSCFSQSDRGGHVSQLFLPACCSRPGPQFALCLWKVFHRPTEPSFEGSIQMEQYNQDLEMVSQSPSHWKRSGMGSRRSQFSPCLWEHKHPSFAPPAATQGWLSDALSVLKLPTTWPKGLDFQPGSSTLSGLVLAPRFICLSPISAEIRLHNFFSSFDGCDEHYVRHSVINLFHVLY